jgi:hypothetical protein
MILLEQIMPLMWWAILGVGVLAIIPYFIIILLNSKLKKFQKSYLSLQTFLSGNSLDDLLGQYINEVKKIRENLDQSNKRLEKTEAKIRSSVDRVELVRFNAFENMGSDLSFAMAFLNQEGNGIVLSSINSREESRVYAKPISGGQSTYHLSEEEKKAISKARETIKV